MYKKILSFTIILVLTFQFTFALNSFFTSEEFPLVRSIINYYSKLKIAVNNLYEENNINPNNNSEYSNTKNEVKKGFFSNLYKDNKISETSAPDNLPYGEHKNVKEENIEGIEESDENLENSNDYYGSKSTSTYKESNPYEDLIKEINNPIKSSPQSKNQIGNGSGGGNQPGNRGNEDSEMGNGGGQGQGGGNQGGGSGGGQGGGQQQPNNSSPFNYGNQNTGSNFSGFRPMPGSINNAGSVGGMAGDIGYGRATTFAHGTINNGCVADKADQQNSQQPASFAYYKKQGKEIYLSRSGELAIPAVALPSRGSFGDAVEVLDVRTGRCKAFPLLDRGPGSGPLSKGVVIDLTGSAVDILLGKQPCEIVGAKGTIRGGEINTVKYALIPGSKIEPGQVKECSNLVKPINK